MLVFSSRDRQLCSRRNTLASPLAVAQEPSPGWVYRMKKKDTKNRTFILLTFGGFFGYIALWQCLVFFVLILLVWVNELLDLGALLLNLPEREFSWMRASLGTAGILVGGIITVGHTYIQQKQIVSGLLTICGYCKMIRVDSEIWERVEDYISSHSQIMFSHGICPACMDEQTKLIKQRKASAEPAKR